MAITDKKTGVWGLDQTFNKINQGSIWDYSGALVISSLGENDNGQLGVNDIVDRSSPVQVPTGSSDWASLMRLDAGSEVNQQDISGAVKADGSLWFWGGNYGSGMDAGSPGNNYSSPTQLPGTWANISYGGEGLYQGVRADNTLWAWGSNWGGALGQGQTPAQLGSSNSPLQIPGTTWATGEDKIRNGNYYMHAIRTDGTLWAWGGGGRKVLGLGPSHPANAYCTSPKQIPGTSWTRMFSAGGFEFSGCLRTDGTLWQWGRNDYGQLGQNSTSEFSSPKQVPGTDWSQAAANYDSSGAVRTDGTLWMWGRNTQGELGQNSRQDFSSPVQIPGTTWSSFNGSRSGSCYGTKTDGTLWGWGCNNRGQLGQNTGGPGTYLSSPVQIPGTGWNTTKGVAAGARHAYAVNTL